MGSKRAIAREGCFLSSSSEELAHELLDWLNGWADEDRRCKKQWGEWRQRIFRDGYEQAVRDIYPRLAELRLALACDREKETAQT